MKKILRKLTAIFISLLLVFSYVAFSVNAAEENTFSYIHVENTGSDGEWSEFEYDVSEGSRISKCVCGNCGNCMQRAFYSDNVISLDAFIDLLFNKVRLIILKIFSI